jgi:transposase
MALGRRESEQQGELWVTTQELARPAGHVFYERLNDVLAGAGFDAFVEDLCEPYYAAGGRPGIPPGVYFRMLFVGYFEGIESQRGIAWRCGDSLSLRTFLGVPLTKKTPDHSSFTRIADRLPERVYQQVFTFVLDLVDAQGLLTAQTVAVDATLLEANAAMKSIVRKETGEDWKAYLIRLMREEGELADDEEPTDEDLRRFDKRRAKAGKKKVSNQEWESPSDQDARIVRMKDGRTRLGYKAEHVIDLESDVILSARVQHGTEADSQTLVGAVIDAQVNLVKADCEADIQEVTADKGYHANETIAECETLGLRTYIPEPESPHGRTWTDKPEDVQRAVLNNRRRSRRDKGRRLQRQRSEKVERSFAHLCDTGGTRRCWLRGLAKINQRYSLAAAAHNLSLVMRKLFGIGQPRSLQGAIAALCALLVTLLVNQKSPLTLPTPNTAWNSFRKQSKQPVELGSQRQQIVLSSTGC